MVSGGAPGGLRHRLLEEYAERLAAAPLNLVSRADRELVSAVHIPESVLVAQRLAPPAAARVVDLGSGGGLPGVVIAVCAPTAVVRCVDARRKKMTWLASTCAALGIANVTAVAGRAEELARRPEHRGAADVVVSRALSSVVVVAELARGFLVAGGELVVVKGPDPSAEVARAAQWAARLGYAAPRVESLVGAPRPTTLVRMRARGGPPRWVPRSDGQPQRQPLGE